MQPVGRSLKSACVFGIGTALQRGIAFLLLPLYTRALTPAEYGTLSVLLAVTSAASMLFGFGLDMGLFRSFFLYADDPRRKRDFLGSIWRFLIVAPVGASVVCTAIAVPFLAGTTRVTPLEVLLALLAGAFYVGASAVPLVILRVEQRLRDFMALAIVDAVATTTLTVVLVVWQHDGILGWLIAAAGSNAILLLAATRIVPWDRGARYSGELVRERCPVRRHPDPARVCSLGAAPDRSRRPRRTRVGAGARDLQPRRDRRRAGGDRRPSRSTRP